MRTAWAFLLLLALPSVGTAQEESREALMEQYRILCSVDAYQAAVKAGKQAAQDKGDQCDALAKAIQAGAGAIGKSPLAKPDPRVQ